MAQQSDYRNAGRLAGVYPTGPFNESHSGHESTKGLKESTERPVFGSVSRPFIEHLVPTA
jgi:hypothetical protein